MWANKGNNCCPKLKCIERKKIDKIFINPYNYNQARLKACPGQKPIYQELSKGNCYKPKRKNKPKAHAMPSQLSFSSSFPWTAA